MTTKARNRRGLARSWPNRARCAGAVVWITMIASGRLTFALELGSDDAWSCVFAGDQIEWRPIAKSVEARVDGGTWRLIVDGRTVGRGRVSVAKSSAGGVRCRVELPETRDGVIVAAQLEAILHLDDGSQTTIRRPLTLFPDDPLATRRDWLSSASIELFDPAGRTGEVLTELGARFTLRRSVASLRNASGDLLVIGQDVSWSDHRGLVDAVFAAIERGASVLCLAPAAGSLPVTTPAFFRRAPVAITLKQSDVIRGFDKRLDVQSWQGQPAVRAGIALEAVDGEVRAVIDGRRDGWPWLECKFNATDRPDEPTTLAICGFDVVESWDNGPVPRYLLAGILKELIEPAHRPESAEN